MSYKPYMKLWESGFHNIVSKRDKLQHLKPIQLKLEIHDSYKKDEKPTTNFEHTDNTNVVNKTHLEEKLSKNKVRFLILKKTTKFLNHNTTNDLWKKF